MRYPLKEVVSWYDTTEERFCLDRVRAALGIARNRSDAFASSLPFSLNDTTAGTETELQVAVQGNSSAVDLPLVLLHSNYYANICKRAAAGDTSSRAITNLKRFIEGNREALWENSWVRFPVRFLSPFTQEILQNDLLSDKRNPLSPLRTDAAAFRVTQSGEEYLRIPISYLIKLALAEVVGVRRTVPPVVKVTALKFMEHFLSDNTSPETFSFYVVPFRSDLGFGRAVAKENAKRYLLTQLLVMYANRTFGLEDLGQKALIYYSPHPPIRQKRLNECISDSFYRELFMNPCLSGWYAGQAKREYMALCHKVLSRSQLNAVAKLREAGIITRNLVVMPNLSNISLANNGTHLSLGSSKLSQAREDPLSGFNEADEKYLGDLAIKIVEHFLPLFVGAYSAAPYRLDFTDFHPERVLGFLPHELDYTHLRMIWRRWKQKARLKILGRPLTPFGLEWLDRALSVVFRLKGDYVPDFRLIDYLVAVLSTDRSPALDGTLHNGDRLKRDLEELGVFDQRMSLYTLYRLREFDTMGFSGFEGRHYSLFENLSDDVAEAANLQTLVTALAYKLIFQGSYTHRHIPDDPSVESERRQIFFCSAIGIPTFYVRHDTGNLFLKRIIERTQDVRYSRRYPGFLRVYVRQFCLALIKFIRLEAGDLIELLGLEETVSDLFRRWEEPRHYSAEGRLVKGILSQMGERSPLDVEAGKFNAIAELYYRTTLRKRHIKDAMAFLREDIRHYQMATTLLDEDTRAALRAMMDSSDLLSFLDKVESEVVTDTVSPHTLTTLIDLVIISLREDARRSLLSDTLQDAYESVSPSIHRAS